MSGWIKDYRREVESDIWLMPPMYHRVWQWVKYSVNHKEAKIPNKDGTFTTIKPGQRATSYRQIAKGVGFYEGLKWKEPNVKTIKSILDWMVKQEMITIQGNTLGTIVTVDNWEVYQLEESQGNTKRTAMETPSKHDLDTNKNEEERIKNEKKKKSSMINESFKAIRKLYPGTKTLAVAEKKLIPLIKDHGEEEMIRVVERYKESVLHQRNDGHKDLSYLNESTFWNGRYKDFLDEYYQEPVKTKKAPVKNDNNRFQNFEGTLAGVKNDDLKAMMDRQAEKRKQKKGVNDK